MTKSVSQECRDLKEATEEADSFARQKKVLGELAESASNAAPSVQSTSGAAEARWWAPKLTREYMESGAAPVAQSDGARELQETVGRLAMKLQT